MILFKKLAALALSTLIVAGLVNSADAGLIAGVDFENGSGGFSSNPDDLDLADGISVSASFPGAGNDGGANADVAYEGIFVGRFQSTTGVSWSITIPDTVALDLEQITFAVRAATTGSGRDVQFRTSLDGPTEFLYENLNLPGRTATPDWAGAPVPIINLTDAKYKGLTNTSVSFIWISPAGGVDFDGILVSGTVTPIPEPTTFALAAFGLVGLFGWRRRRS